MMALPRLGGQQADGQDGDHRRAKLRDRAPARSPYGVG